MRNYSWLERYKGFGCAEGGAAALEYGVTLFVALAVASAALFPFIEVVAALFRDVAAQLVRWFATATN